MIWNICFFVSVITLFFSVLHAIVTTKRYKCDRIFTPFYVIFAGVFLSIFIGLVPMFASMLANESYFILKLIVFDTLQTIQVFTINVGADLILDNINSITTSISETYSSYMAIMFFVAPVLTFGFLVSLFKNTIEKMVYKIHYFGDVYVFSEMNEKSLILAESIKSKHKTSLIVFTNVDREEGNILSEHIETAKMMKAILFKKNIVTVDFMKHSKKSQITFFTIGEKENVNLIHSLKLVEKYNHRKNTSLYVFSSNTEGELLLSNVSKGEIMVRRVNEARALIYGFLYDEGIRIFSSAVSTHADKKSIHAVVVGLGKYGTEMLKALTWFLQMDGYSVEIDVFDSDELAEQKFTALCPEIMDKKYNGVQIDGESEYTINIHAGMDIRTKDFADTISSLSEITFVFVCLGDDEDNINQAANIRMLCERAGHNPIIKTVVYNTEEKDALIGITNYRCQSYGIEPIGDLNSSYSEKILLGSELEKLALERHLKWGKEEEFWQYEYNYRSSMASAIHMKARIDCGFLAAGKKENELTPMERDSLEILEHKRWNAYMRSEGYVYSGSHEKSSRNDLAKMHHDLVDFESLTEEEKRKDGSVGSL